MEGFAKVLPDADIFVYDDGSSDGTIQIAKSRNLPEGNICNDKPIRNPSVYNGHVYLCLLSSRYQFSAYLSAQAR